MASVRLRLSPRGPGQPSHLKNSLQMPRLPGAAGSVNAGAPRLGFPGESWAGGARVGQGRGCLMSLGLLAPCGLQWPNTHAEGSPEVGGTC